MSRCNLDAVLYRIFCVVTLSIAVISTAVLIDVVLDIKGVSTKEKTKIVERYQINDVEAVFIQDRFKTDTDNGSTSDEIDYRNKRSLGKLKINTVVDILAPERERKDITEDVHDKIHKNSSSIDYVNESTNSSKSSKPDKFDTYDINQNNKYFIVPDREDILKQKRNKRHIKIRYETDDKTKKKPNPQKTDKKEELIVEIETHFDSKGPKGEKRKKFIKDIVEKIEKAINNNGDDKVKKKQKHLHIKKRIQESLDHKSKAALINKLALPYDGVKHRAIEYISKSYPLNEPLPFVGDRNGDNWSAKYLQPHFLSSAKAINSAELAQLDTDYNQVLEINGIPQRLQKPINTDGSEELPSTYYDLGDLKFFIKDIAGSGFSIGFNQYKGTEPDAETMKLFTGLENIIQNYHQNFDLSKPIENFEDVIPEINTPNSDHTLTKRSFDSNPNTRQIIDSNFIQYNDYRDILNDKLDYKHIYTNTGRQLVLDHDMFKKDLVPAEILTLANLFRKKRSYGTLKRISTKRILKQVHRRGNMGKVKRISRLKNKLKLNSKSRPKKIFITKKRNKRQIGKIRIIATDSEHHRHSGEDIFVVSDEKVYSDRAIIREMNIEPTLNMEPVQTPDEYNKHVNYRIAPYLYDPYENIYSKSVRNNPLMSKYPHIFLEEISRSKEYEPVAKVSDSLNKENLEIKQEINSTDVPEKVGDILNALSPKSNYKLSVKITPKNNTDINSGYKEIHTIINNSFNRDGLQYSSLVNVSEISKVVKLNKTNAETHEKTRSNITEANNKMKHFLEEDEKRIYKQLRQLNVEKEKLESVANKEAYVINQNDSVKQEKIIEKYKPKGRSNVILKTEIQQMTTESNKQLLENSIRRNEKFTIEILKKIDKNTNLLQTFLDKVIKSIEMITIGPKLNENTEFQAKYLSNHNMTNIKDINAKDIFNKTASNLESMKNHTHVSIPFVYTFQKDNTQEPSSIVYHGHIHANIPEKNNKKLYNVKREVNQSKFFIDDLENEYGDFTLDKKRAAFMQASKYKINGTV